MSGAYFSQGLAQSLTVRMDQFARPVTAKWVDPTSGSSSTISGSPLTNSGTGRFSPSGNNSAGDSDWALLSYCLSATYAPLTVILPVSRP